MKIKLIKTENPKIDKGQIFERLNTIKSISDYAFEKKKTENFEKKKSDIVLVRSPSNARKIKNEDEIELLFFLHKKYAFFKIFIQF